MVFIIPGLDYANFVYKLFPHVKNALTVLNANSAILSHILMQAIIVLLVLITAIAVLLTQYVKVVLLDMFGSQIIVFFIILHGVVQLNGVHLMMLADVCNVK